MTGQPGSCPAVRIVGIAALLALLSGCDARADKSLEVSAARIAEIRETPYVPGNNRGGFATARLAGIDSEETGAVEFTGFGPYLYELGFRQGMSIRAIDGADPRDVLADRWAALRLADASAYDAEHYRDLVRYLFLEQGKESVDLTVAIPRETELATSGAYREGVETWRITLEHR